MRQIDLELLRVLNFDWLLVHCIYLDELLVADHRLDLGGRNGLSFILLAAQLFAPFFLLID